MNVVHGSNQKCSQFFGEVFVRNSEKHSCYVIMTYQVSKMEQQIGQISQCIIV